MRRLNAEVDIEGRDPARVAAELIAGLDSGVSLTRPGG